MTRALVVVDVQADFLRAPGLEPPAEALVAHAGELLFAWRAAGLPVVHVRTWIRDDAERMPHWRAAGVRRCVAGTPGAEAPIALRPIAGEAVIDKTGFDAFMSGQLAAALAAVGASGVVVAGVHEHACVRALALGAYERGLDVVVAEDAVASDDPLHAALSRRWLAARAARFRPVAQIVKGLVDDVAADDLDAIVARARAAQRAWREAPVDERAALLEAIAARLEAEAEALAALIVTTVKKPVRMARAEVARAAELSRVAARHAGDAADAPRGPGSRARWRPLGVVAALTPWNNPLAIPLGKIAPALAFGNAVVLKPAPRGQVVAEVLLATLARAGLPVELVGLARGGAEVGRRLLEHAGVDGASVTGAYPTGVAAMALAGRRHLPLQAELGGNNAAIVWSSVEGEAAAEVARELVAGAFGFAGQRCTANRRVIVPRAALEAWLVRLEAAMAALVWGEPEDPDTVMGPLVDAEAAVRVMAAVTRAWRDGHPVITRAGGPTGPGHAPPVIVVCEDRAHPIVLQETFGPVLVVQPAVDFDEALALQDGVAQGLVAALFGGSPVERARFLAEARAGVLKLDRATSDADAHAPFGGWKASGLGPAEHGPHDRDFYTRVQAVYEEPA